jgi:hypothetical protein
LEEIKIESSPTYAEEAKEDQGIEGVERPPSRNKG